MLTGNWTSTNHKAFMLALSDAFMDKLADRELVKYALTELGFDPARQIDDQLIAEAVPKLEALGVNYAKCVESIAKEEAFEQAMREVGRHSP